MRFLVVIPTTAGPLTIRSLKPRPALPASAAFADGDYRPLPWSGDYARLVGPDGPLARDAGKRPESYELRLSGSFDTGRSWEAPVALAHLLLGRGHSLVADPAEAEIVLWATGALDLDLRPIAARYALLDKIEQTRALFEAAPQARIAVLLSPDDEQGAAWMRLAGILPDRLLKLDGADMPAAAAQIEAAISPPLPIIIEPASAPKSRHAVAVVAVLALMVFVGAAFMLSGREPEVIAQPSPLIVEAEQPRPPSPPEVAPPPAKPEPAPVIVEELRAPPGQSCRAVAFDAAAPLRKEVTLGVGRAFETSRNDAGLCGLSFRPRDAKTAGFEISQNLKSLTVTPSRLSDGSEVLFFREQVRQNVVYTVQVSILEGGTRKVLEPFTHALVP